MHRSLHKVNDEALKRRIQEAEVGVRTYELDLGMAKSWLQALHDEQRLRTIAGGHSILAMFREQHAAISEAKKMIDLATTYSASPAKIREGLTIPGLHPESRVFFLNEAHTTHTTKAQARKDRKAYKIKQEADALELKILKSKRKKR